MAKKKPTKNTLTEPIEPNFHTIQEGQHTYYTIQSTVTHKTEHNKPNGPLKPTTNNPEYNKWVTNYPEHIAEPWTGTGNNCKPKYNKSYEETHQVWSKTGRHGWWTLKYAQQAIKRLRKASKNNQLNDKDGYGVIMTNYRCNYRIIKITLNKSIQLIPEWTK